MHINHSFRGKSLWLFWGWLSDRDPNSKLVNVTSNSGIRRSLDPLVAQFLDDEMEIQKIPKHVQVFTLASFTQKGLGNKQVVVGHWGFID